MRDFIHQIHALGHSVENIVSASMKQQHNWWIYTAMSTVWVSSINRAIPTTRTLLWKMADVSIQFAVCTVTRPLVRECVCACVHMCVCVFLYGCMWLFLCLYACMNVLLIYTESYDLDFECSSINILIIKWFNSRAQRIRLYSSTFKLVDRMLAVSKWSCSQIRFRKRQKIFDSCALENTGKTKFHRDTKIVDFIVWSRTSWFKGVTISM